MEYANNPAVEFRRRLGLAFVALCLGHGLGSARADEVVRPQKLEDFPSGETTIESAIRVEGVSVLWMNTEALRRDFPQLKKFSDPQIRAWLLANFGYVGSKQKILDGIRQTPIPINPNDQRPLVRPGFAGHPWLRAGVMEARSPDGREMWGLVDLKGIGHGAQSTDAMAGDRKPELLRSQFEAAGSELERDQIRTKDHSDGLATAGEAIAEASRQIALQKLFEMKHPGSETVESYAILRYPFNILKEGGHQEPAALYLRQAQFGRLAHMLFLPETYEDGRGGRQGTLSGTVVDMGGVMITDANLASQFIGGDSPNPQKSNAWRYAHETARAALAQPHLSQKIIDTHIFDEMLAPLRKVPVPAVTLKKSQDRRAALHRYVRILRQAGFANSRIAERIRKVRHNPPVGPARVERGLTESSISPSEAQNLLRILRNKPDYVVWLVLNEWTTFSNYGQTLVLQALAQNPSPETRETLKSLMARSPWIISIRTLAREVSINHPVSEAFVLFRDHLIKIYGPPGIRALGSLRGHNESLEMLRNYLMEGTEEKRGPAFGALVDRWDDGGEQALKDFIASGQRLSSWIGYLWSEGYTDVNLPENFRKALAKEFGELNAPERTSLISRIIFNVEIGDLGMIRMLKDWGVQLETIENARLNPSIVVSLLREYNGTLTERKIRDVFDKMSQKDQIFLLRHYESHSKTFSPFFHDLILVQGREVAAVFLEILEKTAKSNDPDRNSFRRRFGLKYGSLSEVLEILSAQSGEAAQNHLFEVMNRKDWVARAIAEEYARKSKNSFPDAANVQYLLRKRLATLPHTCSFLF